MDSFQKFTFGNSDELPLPVLLGARVRDELYWYNISPTESYSVKEGTNTENLILEFKFSDLFGSISNITGSVVTDNSGMATAPITITRSNDNNVIATIQNCQQFFRDTLYYNSTWFEIELTLILADGTRMVIPRYRLERNDLFGFKFMDGYIVGGKSILEWDLYIDGYLSPDNDTAVYKVTTGIVDLDAGQYPTSQEAGRTPLLKLVAIRNTGGENNYGNILGSDPNIFFFNANKVDYNIPIRIRSEFLIGHFARAMMNVNVQRNGVNMANSRVYEIELSD